MSENEHGVPEEAKNFVAPDESQRIENPEKAEAMARAGYALGPNGEQETVDELHTKAAQFRANVKNIEADDAFKKKHGLEESEWYTKYVLTDEAERSDARAGQYEDLAGKKFDREHPTTTAT